MWSSENQASSDTSKSTMQKKNHEYLICLINERICDEVFSIILKNVPYSHVVSEAYMRYMGLKNEKIDKLPKFRRSQSEKELIMTV